VLYQAIRAIQNDPYYGNCTVFIYSGSEKKPATILEEVNTRFSIKISPHRLHFVSLKTANTLKPDNYKSFTIFWQAVASIKVCFEALNTAPCHLFIDTMGVGFAYPFVKIFFGPKVITYTHYPIIR
jgi:ALG11 mannosyltransferase N-terminus